MISVVIAVRDEGPPSALVLARLSPVEGRGEGAEGAGRTEPLEVLVAATPGTPAGTIEAWRAFGARVLVADSPRGARLSAAAAEARGDLLLFLHADTLLPEGWAAAVRRGLAEGAVGGAFRLAWDDAFPAPSLARGAALRLVAWTARLRTSLTRVPYGDQAPFARRDVYLRIGGHAPWPLLEDVDLFERLRREGRIALLPEEVRTSPRRYLGLGVARTVLGNWRILLAWRLGASPEELGRTYVARRREILAGRPGRGGDE